MEENQFEFELKTFEISEKEFEKFLDFDISIDNIDKNKHINYYNQAIQSKKDYKKSIQNIIIAIKLNGTIPEYYLFLLDILLYIWIKLKSELEKDKYSGKEVSQKSFQCSLILIQIMTLVERIRDIFIKNNFFDDKTHSIINKFNNFY